MTTTPSPTFTPGDEQAKREFPRKSVREYVQIARTYAHLDNSDDYLFQVYLACFQGTARMFDHCGAISEAAALTAYHGALRDEFGDDIANRHLRAPSH